MRKINSRKIYFKFKSKIIDIVSIKKSFQENEFLLRPGIYRYTFRSKDIVYLKNSDTNKFLNRYEKKYSWKNKIYIASKKLFLLPFLKNEDKSNGFNGELLMTSREKDVKIFNFKRDIVLTKIENKLRYETIRDNYLLFTESFSTPFIDKNDTKQIIIERNMRFKPYHKWNNKNIENSFEAILSGIKKHIKNNDFYKEKTTNTLIKDYQTKIEDKNLLKEIKKVIPPNYYSHKWPLIKCHGDLNFTNILLVDEVFYLIDFEDVTEGVIFYDFINYIVVSAMYRNDYKYLDKYLEGYFDEQLDEIFNLYSLNFSSDNRKYYIVVYMLDRIVNFELLNNYDNLDSILNKYLLVLKRI